MLSKTQLEHKKRLVNLAREGGADNLEGWTYAQVNTSFIQHHCPFSLGDYVVIKKEDHITYALCTRTMSVLPIDEEHVDKFDILEKTCPVRLTSKEKELWFMHDLS